jgi:hypothetical protein
MQKPAQCPVRTAVLPRGQGNFVEVKAQFCSRELEIYIYLKTNISKRYKLSYLF